MTPTPAREGLPELPEATVWLDSNELASIDACLDWSGTATSKRDAVPGQNVPAYTADQMQAYAVAYAAALSQPAQVGGEVANHVGWFNEIQPGSFHFIAGEVDPRTWHDNGKPYHRALCALPQPQPVGGKRFDGRPVYPERSAIGRLYVLLDTMTADTEVEKNRRSILADAIDELTAAPPPPSDAAQGECDCLADFVGEGRHLSDCPAYTPPSQPVRVDEVRILSVEEIAIAKAAEHPLEFVTVRTADLRAALSAHKGE